ncbi:hypothetical protein [Treponema bryantii]|uniref:hypothetical protein n=1 Tax=Treponema bryantii TaxID=163 RepID=UPI0003B61BEE|nr:hypothetical protein [Treponema bryantii]
MSSIIALVANKDEGKSTTLNILINLLTEVADYAEIYRESDVDTCAWFKINEKYIYVGTEGDESKTVKNNIKLIDEYNCFIGVVSSRKRGETTEVVRNLENAKILLKDDFENKLPKKMSNNAKNRIIAAKLFHAIFEATVKQLENEQIL